MTLEQKQTLKEFGLHRADVMQGRLEALQAELADMERDYLTIIEAQDAEQQPDVTQLVEALEPVAWLVERERDGTFPRLHHRKDDARRLVESITVHPKASMHPLYIQPPTSAVPEADAERWRPIETAPKDRPILALCQHDADPYFIEGGRRLTTYGAHAEGLTRVEDGPHVVVWGGEYDGDEGVIPAWWFLNDGYFETVANPVAWMSIPATQPAG